MTLADQLAGGHPVWHFALVAAAGVAVFVAIKGREMVRHSWRRAEGAGLPTRRRRPASPTPAVLMLATASAGCAVIHVAVCPEHFREATIYGVFFAVAAAAQAAWAVLILLCPSRRLLAAAAAGNAAIVALWVLTRTVGLPVGSEPWRPEAVGGADAGATQLEIVLAVGSYWLSRGIAVRGRRRHPRPTGASNLPHA
jgi:hypothetical protein